MRHALRHKPSARRWYALRSGAIDSGCTVDLQPKAQQERLLLVRVPCSCPIKARHSLALLGNQALVLDRARLGARACACF